MSLRRVLRRRSHRARKGSAYERACDAHEQGIVSLKSKLKHIEEERRHPPSGELADESGESAGMLSQLISEGLVATDSAEPGRLVTTPATCTTLASLKNHLD